MSALSDSYNNFINTGTAGGRPGGDQINISFTKGKKSPKTRLEELSVLQAERAHARDMGVPIDIEGQRAMWEKEDQALQVAADQRAAAQAAAQLQLQQQQEARAAQQAALARESAQFELARAREQTPIQTQTMQQQLSGQSLSNQRAQIAAEQERYAWNKKQEEIANYEKAARHAGNPYGIVHGVVKEEHAVRPGWNPFTGKQYGTAELNRGDTAYGVISQLERMGRTQDPGQQFWRNAYNTLGPSVTGQLYNDYKIRSQQHPSTSMAQYGFSR